MKVNYMFFLDLSLCQIGPRNRKKKYKLDDSVAWPIADSVDTE